MHLHSSDITTYPLVWPTNWERTASRTPSRYRVSFERARADLLQQLSLLRTESIVISSNVPVRRDGIPYAKATAPWDPGVAVYWMDHSEGLRVIACDKWRGTAENLRAIGTTLTYLRGIQRAGATEAVTKAFSGFAALLPASVPKNDDWRVVMNFDHNEPITEAQLSRRYRTLAQERHPDRGGSHEQMLQLSAAYQAAKAALPESTST